MAHTVLGIDLGSFSIKVAHLEAGFRSTSLLALHERELLPPLQADGGEEPLLARQIRTLRGLCSEQGLRPEMAAAAVDQAGQPATLRVVSLPLSDPKKIEQVLPFELEGQLLGEVEDHVVAFTLSQTGVTVEDGPAGQGSRVVAAAVPRAAVSALLSQLEEAGLEPRLLGAADLACAPLLSQDRAQAEALWPAMVLNLGHRATQVCVLNQPPDGEVTVTFARTIARGGLQLTQAVARALNVDEAAAQETKHRVGLSSSQTGDEARVAQALHDQLRPLMRDLRQTVASYVSLYGAAPRQVLLTGGGARLRGLVPLLVEELGVPVDLLQVPPHLLSAPGAPGVAAPELDPAETSGCAAALGLALAVAGPSPQVNFRKGEFAYRTDYSFLRERAPHLALIALAVLISAGLSAVASLRGLQRESEQLAATLRSETVQLFGEPRTDGAAVSAELNAVLGGSRGGERSIPTTSALDLLEEISRAAPSAGDKKGTGLDVTELNIRPKKTDIKGTATSAQYVDDLAAALGKIPCFKEIEQGKVVSLRNTGPDGKPIDVKQFSFNINTTCP